MKREGIIENKNIPFHILLTLVITAKNEVKDQFDGCTLCYKQCRDIMRNWLEHMGQWERVERRADGHKYVKKKGLKPEKKVKGHPRFETGPGEQAQVDWKENIKLVSKSGSKLQY